MQKDYLGLHLYMQQEFTISGNNHLFWVRMGGYSIFILLLLAFGLYIMVSSGVEFFLYFAPFLAFGIYYFVSLTRTALYRIVFDTVAREVTVDILEYSKVKYRHIIPFDALQIVMRQNLMVRHMPLPWVLKIYANRKLILRQQQDYGWSADELWEIEKVANNLIHQ